MAQIGIFEKAPQKWIQYDEDTEVLLEYVDKEALTKLIKQANEASQKLKMPQGTVYDMFLGKKAVHGWRNMKDHSHPGLLLPNQQPIEHTPENRNMLMTKSRDFSEFVFQKSTNAAIFLESEPESPSDDPAILTRLLEEFGEDDPKN